MARKITAKEMRKDIDILISYIMEVTDHNYEECMVYPICKKYEDIPL